ncbi:putative PIN family toxin of toxin-antitoxin system [Rhizobium petrolearium]|uniref:putative toxin-antitoxin system toxin component, PIN family n=1 Tax=Neorhizobium petrolearium TaxID=515361 RepID=UPI001EEA3611|nr:putative toxin-antitoxin system toxin component, PIN family [Neorhizobium petrolearium]MBP1847671.1 putative PIN family toxin of toxin-antitoxin system [Neorhizobium petrolearium]
MDEESHRTNIDILWDVYRLSAMRLALDTNVIVAAFRSRNGASNLLLRFADRGMVTPLCSPALFLEYEAVLSRPETRQAIGQSLEDFALVMSALAAIAEGVDISFRTRPMLSDVADEMVLEAALNGQAEAIVTHNVKDFRPALGLGMTVVTPGEIVRRLNT